MTHGFCQKFLWWAWAILLLLALWHFGLGILTSDWVPIDVTTYYKGSMK